MTIQNKDDYQTHYKGTSFIPKSNVVMRLLRDFAHFQSQQYTQLEDLFNFSSSAEVFAPLSPQSPSVDLFYANIHAMPHMTTERFIELSYFSKQPALFQKSPEDIMEEIKHKTGQDLPRMDRRINGEKDDNTKYNANLSGVTSLEATDLYYETLMNEWEKQRPHQTIPVDKINQIVLLSRQNVFNLMVDLITKTVSHMVEPELPYIFKVHNETDIQIIPNAMNMVFQMDALWLITRNQVLDPEYPCGKVHMEVFADIEHGTLTLQQLAIQFDLSKCGPPTRGQANRDIPPIEGDTNDASSSSISFGRVIPAIGATAGIIMTPFLLGVMGGTKKTIRRQRKQTQPRPRPRQRRTTRIHRRLKRPRLRTMRRKTFGTRRKRHTRRQH